MNLAELRSKAATCDLCELHKGRLNPVFDKGNSTAPILICGMVPAEEENKVGEPFVGRAGKLLDIILDKAELNYYNVCITNLVKCYLAAGEQLKQDWIDACLPYIIMQINLINPKVILLLGKDAASTMLDINKNTALGAMQGKLYEYAPGVKAVPTYHPSYLLRTGGENSTKFKDVIKHFMYAKELAGIE